MNSLRSRPAAGSARRERGFTLVELLVVMGILSGFLIMLVQLVDAGLRLFGEGEAGQMLADRTSRAQRVVTAELQALRGSATGRDREGVEDRLLVQWLPIGLPLRPEANPTRVQVLRAAVHLSAERELGLLDAALATRLLQQQGDLPAAEVAQQVAALRELEPLRGIGNLLLLPWRQEGADEAVLELRAGWFLPGQKVPVDRDRFVDPFEVVVPGSPELPALLVHQITTPILRDLLHVEFAFWSQRTTGWGSANNPSGGSSSGGASPERVWDSARGGWLVDAASGGEFGFDRGGGSLGDPTDDIHPHAILVRCVVAQPAELAPEGLLGDHLGAEETSLELVDGERFPGAPDGGWLKVRGEWLRYDVRDGDRLLGLRRGQRGTKALEHPPGVRVHLGRSVEFVVPLAHAKDDWNG